MTPFQKLVKRYGASASIVAAASKQIPIYEYSARKEKQSITGNGKAH